MIRFENRAEAGRLLAQSLAEDWVHVDLVCAIPRGGIEAGASVARMFECPLRPVLVAKVRHPAQPELVIGAIDESGRVQLRSGARKRIDAQDLERSVAHARAELEQRRRNYAGRIPAAEARAKVVVLVDDGLASGQSCRAALRWIRRSRPAKLLLAVPCASALGLEEVRSSCDGIVTLAPPDPYFTTVGAYYREFAPITTERAFQLLDQANRRFALRPAA